MVANIDTPTADSESFGKLNPSIRDEYESRVSLCCLYPSAWSNYVFSLTEE